MLDEMRPLRLVRPVGCQTHRQESEDRNVRASREMDGDDADAVGQGRRGYGGLLRRASTARCTKEGEKKQHGPEAVSVHVLRIHAARAENNARISSSTSPTLE